MSVYILVDLEITDPEKFKKYRELVSPLIPAYGGIRWTPLLRQHEG